MTVSDFRMPISDALQTCMHWLSRFFSKKSSSFSFRCARGPPAPAGASVLEHAGAPGDEVTVVKRIGMGMSCRWCGATCGGLILLLLVIIGFDRQFRSMESSDPAEPNVHEQGQLIRASAVSSATVDGVNTSQPIHPVVPRVVAQQTPAPATAAAATTTATRTITEDEAVGPTNCDDPYCIPDPSSPNGDDLTTSAGRRLSRSMGAGIDRSFASRWNGVRCGEKLADCPYDALFIMYVIMHD